MKQNKKSLNKQQEGEKTLQESNLKKFKVKVVNGALDIKGVFRKFKFSTNPDKVICVRMELQNGLHTTFYKLIKEGAFEYNNGSYIVDDDLKYYDINIGCYCLDYHENLSIPIRRKIPLNAINKKASTLIEENVEQAMNPFSLTQFMKSQVIQKVMQGEEMDSLFRFLKIMSILTLLILVLFFGLFLQQSGVLKQIGI